MYLNHLMHSWVSNYWIYIACIASNSKDEYFQQYLRWISEIIKWDRAAISLWELGSYAFHTDRNLYPTWNFTTLGLTVIVMTDVHRSFSRHLPCYQLNFLDLTTLRRHMFLVPLLREGTPSPELIRPKLGTWTFPEHRCSRNVAKPHVPPVKARIQMFTDIPPVKARIQMFTDSRTQWRCVCSLNQLFLTYSSVPLRFFLVHLFLLWI